MRSIPNPQHNGGAIFELCVNSVSDVALRIRLNSVGSKIESYCDDYLIKAVQGELYLIDADHSKKASSYLGVAPKQDFKDLYTVQMAVKGKPARLIYDAILSSAPRGLCPFCGFGYPANVDHYLPKSKYPQFSVFPSNLVPACRDCNVGKLAGFAKTKAEQGIHPYFDEALINEQWLFAQVLPRNFVIDFYVNPPKLWAKDDRRRIHVHFDSLGLASRFATEAILELSTVCDYLTGKTFDNEFTSSDRRKHVSDIANLEYKRHKNSWKTALYQALAKSHWFCNIGYSMFDK